MIEITVNEPLLQNILLKVITILNFIDLPIDVITIVFIPLVDIILDSKAILFTAGNESVRISTTLYNVLTFGRINILEATHSLTL